MSDEINTSESTGSTEQELINIRKEKIEKLRALGINPFGARFITTHEIGTLFSNFEEGKTVTIAGRISAQ